MPRLSAREIVQRFHERYAGTSSPLFAQIVDERGRSAYDLLADAALAGFSPPRVLDLGCGDGAFLAAIAQRDPEAQLYGVDFAADELDLARSRLPHADLQLRDLNEPLSYKDESFDVVTSHMVLMLLANLDRVFASVSRMLRPGGRFAFVVDAIELVPNAYAGGLRHAMRAVGLLQPETRFDTSADSRLYDVERMRLALAAAGLQLTSREQFSLVAPNSEEFAVDLLLASYPFGIADAVTRERAANAIRTWYAREGRAIDVPFQLYVAERTR